MGAVLREGWDCCLARIFCLHACSRVSWPCMLDRSINIVSMGLGMHVSARCHMQQCERQVCMTTSRIAIGLVGSCLEGHAP
jgi:hypothetical protein